MLYHFPKNSDLLMAVHEDTVRRYVEVRNTAANSSDDPGERLLAVMRAGIPPWANEHIIRLLCEMHGQARRSEPHAELLSELRRQEHALYVEIIDAGAAAGLFTPSEPVADLATHLLALEDGLVLHLLGHNAALDSQRVLENLADFAARQLNYATLTKAVTTPA